MIDLQRYFEGLFLETIIIFSRLIAFARDNANNMENNNPGGIYDDSVVATRECATNLEIISSQKLTDKGTKVGGTDAKDLARANLTVYIANQIGWCRSLFGGKNDVRFKATFPNLMKSFYNKSDVVFKESVDALIAKAHTYSSVLGADFESKLTAFLLVYTNASTAHGTQMSDVKTDVITEQMAADALSDQLTDNLLLIARNNRRSKTAATLYFTVSLLYPAKRKKIYKGTVAAHGIKDLCDIEYTASKHAKFKNKGSTRLILGMKLNNEKVGELLIIEPSTEVDVEFSYFYSNGDCFYVVNDGEVEGIYQLTITS